MKLTMRFITQSPFENEGLTGEMEVEIGEELSKELRRLQEIILADNSIFRVGIFESSPIWRDEEGKVLPMICCSLVVSPHDFRWMGFLKGTRLKLVSYLTNLSALPRNQEEI